MNNDGVHFCQLKVIDEDFGWMKRRSDDDKWYEIQRVYVVGLINSFMVKAVSYRWPALFIHENTLYIACSLVDDMLGEHSSSPTLTFGKKRFQPVTGDLILEMLNPFERCHPTALQLERNEDIRKLAEAIIEFLPYI